MRSLWLILVPDLARVDSARREDALKQASRSDLNSSELIAMAVWLVLVFFVTRSILQGATDDNRLTFTIVTNLVFTAPILLAVFIPIHVRRIRRDIKRQMDT